MEAVSAPRYFARHSTRIVTAGTSMGKHTKVSHHHKPAIEKAVPIDRIINLFSRHFDDPYLNPVAELTFEDFRTGFPDLPGEELEEALAHWTGHSGEKLLQTKIIETITGDKRVWYLHGLSKPHIQWSSSTTDRLGSTA